MNMIAAVQSGYRNFLNFSGRARRPEYWWWFLFQVIVSIVIIVIEGGGTTTTTEGGFAWNYNAGPIQIVWCLVNLLPGLAVSVRRMHDLDKSGWWLLIGLIPLVGAIILLVWFGSRGTTGPNRFGPERPA